MSQAKPFVLQYMNNQHLFLYQRFVPFLRCPFSASENQCVGVINLINALRLAKYPSTCHKLSHCLQSQTCLQPPPPMLAPIQQ